ncbi:TOM1-like protein 2 isoform X10 [Portunus trituberculatus]|uniref:TOM1-like protein 2 isoform X10 n=1 Tax=Portunus trituberculatus TaxID=210409 RepID=UPI001E1CDB51|nr:TOM1-like protein 2 isoform X10 [Portunus trituberculatus]
MSGGGMASRNQLTSWRRAMTQQGSKMSFFGGNVFATPVGQKIEQATAETLPSEDWGLNLEVCDLVNESEDGPRDAIKAIRKRLTTQPKNYTVVMYTLTVLEACVKNCGKRFHVHACSKDFVQELVKLIGPKNEPPPSVQEKVLSLIQSWADAFRHQPELSGVSQVYAELKHKGVEFPATDLDTMAPIITPQRTSGAPEPRSIPRPPTSGTGGGMMATSPRRQAPHHPAPPAPTSPAAPTTLTAEQRAKLHSELDVVESNAKVLAEMLTELSPGKEHQEDLQLLQELHATCRAMQQRVVELVGRVSDDLLTADLLRINDNLNNLFIRYDRYMSKVKSAGSPSKTPPQTQPAVPPPQQQPAPEVSLIDLADEAPSAQLASLSVTPAVGASPQKVKKNEDADFDMFAQSRTATYENTKTSSSTYQDNTEADTTPSSLGRVAQVRHNPEALWQQKDTDFEEMEAWLNEQPVPAPREETISSSEFDRFLEERAAAADALPTITAATGSSGPRQRTLARDDKDTNQMFAL